MDFDTFFKSGTVASRRSNLGGGVNVRGPLTYDSRVRTSPPEPVLVLQSDLAADLILLCNIGSYPYHSKSTPLPPSTFLLFRPWLPMQEHEGTIYIM